MSSPPSILITGASTGIGLTCALRFDQLGWRVFAGVRRAEDADRLRDLGSPRVHPLRLDVTDATGIAAARDEIAAVVGDDGLAALVNNAGIAQIGPLEFVSLDAFRRVHEVNVVGLLAVTQAFLPLIRRARGRIVNMGSISGRTTSPFVGPYCAAKHAVEAVTDALRLELAEWGIEVAVVEPGMITTPIWDKGEQEVEAQRRAYPPEAERLYGPLMDAFSRMVRPAIARAGSPELVADAVEHAVTAGEPRTRYLVGHDARIRMALRTLLPDRVMDGLIFAALRRARRDS